MDCPACGAGTLAFTVPPEYREYLPGEAPGAALCTRCLRLHPVEEPDGTATPAAETETEAEADADAETETPDFTTVSDAFPSNPDAAVPLALLVGLLDSLAQYRSEISALLGDVERAGTDPFLALDRLARDPAIEAAADLETRRRQLEQLL